MSPSPLSETMKDIFPNDSSQDHQGHCDLHLPQFQTLRANGQGRVLLLDGERTSEAAQRGHHGMTLRLAAYGRIQNVPGARRCSNMLTTRMSTGR